jgi:serine/threonine protein kinase
MLFLLSEFVFSQATPHINLPVASFLCLSDTKHVKRYTISETAALGNMHRFVNKYLKKYPIVSLNTIFWKVLFFQILSTLAIIHKVYPNFLHNDLKPNNILVRPTRNYQNISLSQKEYFKYTVNGQDYYVPDLGYQILLWDFDFGAIAGHIDNDKLIYMIDDDANLTMHKNQYYDIRMLFGLIHRYWSSQMPAEVESWITDYVISKRLKASDHDERLLEAVEYTTPAKLLASEFFKEFKQNIGKEMKIIDNYTGELNGSMKFNFDKELNRYTNPKSCAYKNFVFFDPKKPTQEEKELFANRYKCTLASTLSRGIQTYYVESQMENISEWINDVLSTIISNNMITKKELDKIFEKTVELLKKFIELYHVPINYLYCVSAAIMMYASYTVLLSYEKPFNKFAWWYQNEKLKEFESGILEDTFKQICDFAAKHIEL